VRLNLEKTYCRFDCFDDKKMTNRLIELNKKFRNFASHDAFPFKELGAWRELLYHNGFLRDLISRFIPYEKKHVVVSLMFFLWSRALRELHEHLGLQPNYIVFCIFRHSAKRSHLIEYHFA